METRGSKEMKDFCEVYSLLGLDYFKASFIYVQTLIFKLPRYSFEIYHLKFIVTYCMYFSWMNIYFDTNNLDIAQNYEYIN